MRDPLSVSNAFQSYIPRFSRLGIASDVFTERRGRKRVIRARDRVQRGAIPEDWSSVKTPPSFRPVQRHLSLTSVPACEQVS